jgi:hypothetical protein
MRKVHRDAIVAMLREAGQDEAADRAERELPTSVDTVRMQGKLRSLGVSLGAGLPAGGGGGGGDLGGGGDGGG